MTSRLSPELLNARSLAAVATVPPSYDGVAACAPHIDLFDLASSGHSPADIRHRAAGICARCPLAARCAFRIQPPRRYRPA
ncbi:hypothetical protein [Streptomyces benahoarensis]|uniref:4Fe-4S Wbl-type domain-containing protein n=1 Tax=Streptomyces benahoarensis TaxID=2595054 RepID=A0A553YWG2_9ACTN|nr:hypothetical protein [Streptomyces benahoarensis]TSB17772.1 hypothetical protein FNJ62_26490 [Streptomyces benahoarensis]TSB33534.1 hypothetical protein FNZ23_23425 [Streptomyces benahoarensis]